MSRADFTIYTPLGGPTEQQMTGPLDALSGTGRLGLQIVNAPEGRFVYTTFSQANGGIAGFFQPVNTNGMWGMLARAQAIASPETFYWVGIWPLYIVGYTWSIYRYVGGVSMLLASGNTDPIVSTDVLEVRLMVLGNRLQLDMRILPTVFWTNLALLYDNNPIIGAGRFGFWAGYSAGRVEVDNMRFVDVS